jgi:hypothetical protein
MRLLVVLMRPLVVGVLILGVGVLLLVGFLAIVRELICERILRTKERVRNVKDFEDCGVDVINPWTE